MTDEEICKKSAVLIPAYEPDEKLLTYLDSLTGYGFGRMIVVDDGSSEKCRAVFDNVRERENCDLIEYQPNGGKGHALKKGIRFFLDNCPEDITCIVTADADGQHTAPDAAAVAALAQENPECMILGSRDFSGENIPARSRMGNKITSAVFKLTHGAKVGDTQTGLRGMSRSVAEQTLDVSGERYEYEMNVLIECADKGIEMKETPIETIYINENESSHFRPVRDSMRIYSLILKKPVMYALSSMTGFLVDIGLFTLFMFLLPDSMGEKSLLGTTLEILLATVAARIVSSLYNFLVNRFVVFKSGSSGGRSLVRYYILAAVQMVISAFLVSNAIRLLGLGEGFTASLVKCVVDILLFFASYQIQRTWVFKKDEK